MLFDPTNIRRVPDRLGFINAFNSFMSNFTVKVEGEEKKYILKTFNSVEKDFQTMEEEANKIIGNSSDARYVRKSYGRKDFMACVESADSCGIYLSIPDHLVSEAVIV